MFAQLANTRFAHLLSGVDFEGETVEYVWQLGLESLFSGQFD